MGLYPAMCPCCTEVFMGFSGDGNAGQICEKCINKAKLEITSILKEKEPIKDTNKFLELAKKTEALHEELKSLYLELRSEMEIIGVDSYIQDPNTLAVYKIIKPIGTFIEFRTIDYKRTAMEGERGGTVLSKKEAEEQGFVLKK